MAQYRVLVSWIGHTDLRAMASSLPDSQRKEILSALKGPVAEQGPGPIKTLLNHEAFNAVHLLSNYKPAWGALFARWVGAKPKIHQVELANPTDHARIFVIVDSLLSKLLPELRAKEADLSFHLSPGTPAMAAIWILLGKSRYPATFYQTYQDRAWITKIPFDLVDDFVPELLRDPDRHLQHLAASKPSEVAGFQEIVGESQAIRLAVGSAKRAAVRHVSVLLLGESGTGKELFAKAIHSASKRASGPFVPVNCAALPTDLLDSALFGHKKGAFTGAVADSPGAFEEADGGTLFLDEIGECDRALQAKLLRVLQPPPNAGPCERVFCRVGEFKERRANVRVIAATNRDLLAEVQKGSFRADLYYRLAAITVNLPPLRQRKRDIPLIAAVLMRRINAEFEKEEPGYRNKTVSDAAMEFVKQREWLGNVRELHNVLMRAAVMAGGDELGWADIAAAVTDMPGRTGVDVLEHPLGDGFNLESHLATIRKHFLRRAMQEAQGVKTRAARLLGFRSYQALDAQLKRLRVEWQSRRM